MASPGFSCASCGVEASKALFAQNQLKRFKRNKTGQCRSCLPPPPAEEKAATEAKELADFNAKVSSGAMDGASRRVNGRKRKAQAPSQHMKDKAVPLIAELEALYDVSTFSYKEAAARQAAALEAELSNCGDPLSSTGARVSAELRALEGAQERLATLTWIDSRADRAVPEAQQRDFMTTLRAGAHGSRERVRHSALKP